MSRDTDEAMARDQGAGKALEAEALVYEIHSAIRKAAKIHPVFTSDDVWEILDNWGISTLEHPNAMGASFLRAAKHGLIENTGTVWRSARKGSRKRAVMVWKSTIYEGPR